jgi:hypothetical protein
MLALLVNMVRAGIGSNGEKDFMITAKQKKAENFEHLSSLKNPRAARTKKMVFAALVL